MKLKLTFLSFFILISCFAFSQNDSSKTDINKYEEKPFIIAEHMPEFPGGIDSLMKFLRHNINYPIEARVKNIQGNVILQFVVEKDGSVDRYKVLRGIGSGCDEEAIRVVKLMSKWKPGTQSGIAVPVYFQLPIKFILQSQKVSSKTQIKKDEEKPLLVVEKMPEYPGGTEELMNYLKNNVIYPDEAIKYGVQGTVIVRFVVEKDGTIDNCKVIRGIGWGCDNEALRVVKSMPKWKPGTHNDVPVPVNFPLPIKFTLK